MRIVRPRFLVEVEHQSKELLYNEVKIINQRLYEIIRESKDKDFRQIYYREDIQNLISKLQEEYPKVGFVWKMSTKSDVWYDILPYYLTIS